MRTAPLDGIRVLELASYLSGPYAGTLLADFGADVIKIELPTSGDPMRQLGTPVSAEPDAPTHWWLAVGRNKRTVTLDVRTKEGRDIFARLLRDADAVIENFRPGTLESWGIGPEWMRKIKPDLVVLRVSGYGQTGPRSGAPGFDRNAQAYSGLLAFNGEEGNPPMQVGIPICDYLGGLWGALGILLALIGRLRGKQSGDIVDLALYETVLPFFKDSLATAAVSGREPTRFGNKPGYVAPGGAYLTCDQKWIFLSATGDPTFARLAQAMGMPELATDPRFASHRARLENAGAIEETVSSWVQSKSSAEVIRILEDNLVPVVKVSSIGDLLADPHIAERGNLVGFDEPGTARTVQANVVPRLTYAPGKIRWLGADLGSFNEAVYCDELGLSNEELSSLRRKKVI